MKSLANAEDTQEILRRIRTLSPQNQRTWGKMTVNQMICHLTDSFRGPMGQKKMSTAQLWVPRGLYKWVALYVFVKWPPGVKTRPELDPQLNGTQPTEFRADVEELCRMIEVFCSAPRPFTWKPHPMFGKMSDQDWLRWGYLHVNHHLRQFGA